MDSEKLSAHVRDVIEQARANDEEVQVIVRFQSAQSQRKMGSLTSGAGAIKVNQEFRLIPATALSLSPATLDELSHLDEVENVWLDEMVHILLDVSTPLIRAPEVWEQLNNTGEGVTICMPSTPALMPIIQTSPDALV